MNAPLFNFVLLGWIIVAVIVFVALFFRVAPYGRYFTSTIGPSIKGKIGWMLMEAPAPLVFAGVYAFGAGSATAVIWVFLAIWELHYVDRAFVYPNTLRISARRFPLIILAAGLTFNFINASLNSLYIMENTLNYRDSWFLDARFPVGLAVFLAGFLLNRYADYKLYRVKAATGQGYGVPFGGPFRWVSCPNYLGEITMWIGWTVITWSPVAATFLLWTIANLVPRARSHHQWYHRQFTDYPPQRKALLPLVW